MEIGEGAYTLLGVTLGALATQLSTWLSTRQADQRIVREALYSLLELHGLLAGGVRANAYLPAVATRIRQLVPTAPLPEYEQAIDELLTKMLREVMSKTITPLVSQRLTDLKADYAAALLKLATVDPVSAYRLRGQQNVLEELPDYTESLQHTVATHLGQPHPAMPEVMAQMRQRMEPQSVADTRDLVRDVVRELATRLDRRTRHRVATLLAQAGPDEQEIAQKIEAMMQQVREVLAGVGQ